MKKDESDHEHVCAEHDQFGPAKTVNHLAEFCRDVDSAAEDGKPFHPFPVVPQAIGLDEPYGRVSYRGRGEEPDPAVTELSGKMQEYSRKMASRVQMEMPDQSLGHGLNVAMCQGKQTQPCRQDQHAFGTLDERHNPQSGVC